MDEQSLKTLLGRHGSIESFVMPPQGGVAVVKFTNGQPVDRILMNLSPELGRFGEWRSG